MNESQTPIIPAVEPLTEKERIDAEMKLRFRPGREFNPAEDARFA